MFTINGHNYYPQQFTVIIEDVDKDSGRDLTMGAFMKRTRIGVKRTLQIVMPPMRREDAEQLLKDIRHESMNVTYYDPYYNRNHTSDFYVGNRTCTMYYEGDTRAEENIDTYSNGQKKYANNMPYAVLWKSISFDLVEM